MAVTHFLSLALVLLFIASGVKSQGAIPPGCPQPGGPPPVGPVPANCPPPLPQNNGPLCGVTADASQFSIASSGSSWRIQSNSCPNYDWTDQKTPARGAVQQSLNFLVPRHPILQKGNGTFVGTSNPVRGPIGVAFNAVALFSPIDALGRDALIFEGSTFDHCGGHVAPGPNIYHYHTMPGDSSPGSHTGSTNVDFGYCAEVAPLVERSSTEHSPIFGLFYDGVPIYGPRGDNGQLPQDLDACNGHVDQSFPYYHYHATSTYPYLVNCLKGCVDQSVGNNNFRNAVCVPDDVQYDYSSLASQFPRTALQAAVYDAPGTCDSTGVYPPLNQCFNSNGSKFSCCSGSCGPSGSVPTCEGGYTFPNAAPVNTPGPSTGSPLTPPGSSTGAPVTPPGSSTGAPVTPPGASTGAPVDTPGPSSTAAPGPTSSPGQQPVNAKCDAYSEFPNQCFNSGGRASICCAGQCPLDPTDTPRCQS